MATFGISCIYSLYLFFFVSLPFISQRWLKVIPRNQRARCLLMPSLCRRAERNIRRKTLKSLSILQNFPRNALRGGRYFSFVSFKPVLVGFHTLCLLTFSVAPGGCFLPLRLILPVFRNLHVCFYFRRLYQGLSPLLQVIIAAATLITGQLNRYVLTALRNLTGPILCRQCLGKRSLNLMKWQRQIKCAMIGK